MIITLLKKGIMCYTAHIVNIRSLCKANFTFYMENLMWTAPTATEMRFGFEVTMYIMNK
jgi:pyrroloquinoline quinone biosynthesis protein A